MRIVLVLLLCLFGGCAEFRLWEEPDYFQEQLDREAIISGNIVSGPDFNVAPVR